jgi:hypothetical protein
MTQSPSRTRAAVASAVVLAAVSGVLVTGIGTSAAGSAEDKPGGAQVAQLRKDVARYADVAVALADGFVPGGPCAQSPAGGMGVHYVHPTRLQQPLDPRKPQVLLYEPTPDGPALVGAEFLVPDADQRLDTDGDRPSLLGQRFDGPMPGHEPGMPVHYDLHVWTDKANPSGVFSPWNRRVSC